MDTILFCRFISNCLHIHAVCADHDDVVSAFENSHCFDTALQPMYTAKSLKLLFESAKAGVFYEITDYLTTCLLLFKFDEHNFILGPYVKTLASTNQMQKILSKNSLPVSVLKQIKLYHSKYPMLHYSYITDIALCAMRSFLPLTLDFEHRRLTGFHEDLSDGKIIGSAKSSYINLLKRYEAENFFLSKIRAGDTKGVVSALQEISSNFSKGAEKSEIDYYSNHHEGFTILRTLTRKAAEQGGCPVAKIDEITQQAIQKIHHTRSYTGILSVQLEMILRLTLAVDKAKVLHTYSPLIKNIVMYIDANYSESISLSKVATENHVSKEHLSRLFKKETKMTPSEYIARTRCEKAAELLKNTKLSITEISEMVGYSDNNYFVKVFKKHFEETPSEWRQHGGFTYPLDMPAEPFCPAGS